MKRLGAATLAIFVLGAAPAAAKTTLKLEGVAKARAGRIVPAGQRFVVRGTVTPVVAGQQATVRLFRNGRKVRAKRLAVQPGGRFELGFTVKRRGRLTVRAGSSAVRLRVVRSSALPGERGEVVGLIQRRLRALGYKAPRTRHYDAATARAVLTYRKVRGFARTTSASASVVRGLMRGAGVFRARFPDHGKHVEADLSRQVIALLRGKKVVRVLTTSSGAPWSPTVRGHFRFYRKDPGTNGLGMVHSSYFHGGYAIHGYHSVPPFPASHGCLRIPIPDAASVFRWVSKGDRIDVYP